MTRREFAAWLAELFDPFGIPVAPSPGDAAKPPCLIVGPGSPYRERATACWTHTLTVTAVAARMDDVDPFDRLDELADTVCRITAGGGHVINRGSSGAPTVQAIGDVDYLAVTFDFTVYELGPGLEI